MTARNESLLHLLSQYFLILGGIVWGILGLTGYNILSRGARALGVPNFTRLVYLMIGLASVLMLLRFTNKAFVCFGGDTIFPPKLINLGYPLDYDQEVTVNAPAGATYVVYWASQGIEDINDGLSKSDAYGDFINSGAVEVQEGQAILRFKKPTSYIKNGEKISPHVNFRWGNEQGNLSGIDSIYV